MTELSQVYGMNNNRNLLSYAERDIDRKFREALADEGKSVIVVYGASKQGKSWLRRNILPEEYCLFVPAGEGMSLEGLYREVLNQAKATGPVITTTELVGEIGTEAAAPWWLQNFVDAKVTGGVKVETRHERHDIDIDYSSAASISRVYRSVAGRRPIVIDNFHHFDEPMQKKFSQDIRAFEDRGIKIVLMGTWESQDYIERKNGELTGRVSALSIEPWSRDDLLSVIDQGEGLLNVTFSQTARDFLLQKCSGNVALLQCALMQLLKAFQVSETQVERKAINPDSGQMRRLFQSISSEILAGQLGRLRHISEVGEAIADGKTRMYFILQSLIEDVDVTNQRGVSFDKLYRRTADKIQSKAGRSLSRADFAMRIKVDLGNAQRSKIGSRIIDYDVAEDRLYVADSWLMVTVRHHRQYMIENF